MRRSLLVMLLVAAVLLAGCTGGPRQARGSGLEFQVLNLPALQHLYFTADDPVAGPELRDAMELDAGAELVRLGELNVLLHNAGYADTLAALYVTGYDPNLFTVVPLGGYVLQNEPIACYQDVQVTDDAWSVYAICEAGDDLYIGGGLSESGDRARIDAYNLNIEDWIVGLAGRLDEGLADVIDRWDIFSDLDVVCESPTDRLRVSCQVRGTPAFYYQRSSRGQLALALFSESIRECGNGCTVVPNPARPEQYIAGDTENFPGGEYLYVDYGLYLNRARWPPNLNDYENQPFQVTACSLYTTYATPTVCIDPTPFSDNGDVCRPGVMQMKTQPAPLMITSIEQQPQGGRVLFTIEVQNARGGDVFMPGAVNYCSPGMPERYARQVIDRAEIIDARVLGEVEPLDCREGVIRLVNGRGRITCFYDLPPEALRRPAYQTTLNIEIAYMYREQATVSSSIHKI